MTEYAVFTKNKTLRTEASSLAKAKAWVENEIPVPATKGWTGEWYTKNGKLYWAVKNSKGVLKSGACLTTVKANRAARGPLLPYAKGQQAARPLAPWAVKAGITK